MISERQARTTVGKLYRCEDVPAQDKAHAAKYYRHVMRSAVTKAQNLSKEQGTRTSMWQRTNECNVRTMRTLAICFPEDADVFMSLTARLVALRDLELMPS